MFDNDHTQASDAFKLLIDEHPLPWHVDADSEQVPETGKMIPPSPAVMDADCNIVFELPAEKPTASMRAEWDRQQAIDGLVWAAEHGNHTINDDCYGCDDQFYKQTPYEAWLNEEEMRRLERAENFVRAINEIFHQEISGFPTPTRSASL